MNNEGGHLHFSGGGGGVGVGVGGGGEGSAFDRLPPSERARIERLQLSAEQRERHALLALKRHKIKFGGNAWYMPVEMWPAKFAAERARAIMALAQAEGEEGGELPFLGAETLASARQHQQHPSARAAAAGAGTGLLPSARRPAAAAAAAAALASSVSPGRGGAGAGMGVVAGAGAAGGGGGGVGARGGGGGVGAISSLSSFAAAEDPSMGELLESLAPLRKERARKKAQVRSKKSSAYACHIFAYACTEACTQAGVCVCKCVYVCVLSLVLLCCAVLCVFTSIYCACFRFLCFWLF